MAGDRFFGNLPVPVIINQIDDENIKISNQSLRLDTMRFPINYYLKWNIGGVQHSQTIALSAGSEQTINKSDWRDLDAFPRSTENLKLSIVAQNEHIGFSLGHSRNMSVIEAIDLHETESGIRTTIKIIDMDGNHSTEDYDLELPIVSKSGVTESLQIPRPVDKIIFSEDFKKSSITIDAEDIIEDKVARTTKISTLNNEKLLISYSEIYRLKFTQKEIIREHAQRNNLCFSVINCNDNGEEQQQSNEIKLSFSDTDACAKAVNEFNSRSDYFLTENPRRNPHLNELLGLANMIPVEISSSETAKNYAFEVIYLEHWIANSVDISIFTPHITLRKSEQQAVEITNVQFKYDDGGFPDKLIYTYKTENKFDASRPQSRNWVIPDPNSTKTLINMLPYLEIPRGWQINRFMPTLGERTKTGWRHKGVLILKSSFKSAPYIPLKMNEISKYYTGQGIMENFYFDVFDGTIHLSPPNEFNGMGLIQRWMLEKQVPTVESIAEIQRYFDDVRIWEE